MAKLLSTLTNLLCATGTFTTIATLAVLLTTVNVCEASSNTVSITHRSYTNNHNDDNNVEVIKSEPQRNEEYVTSFYKRVREKHRANFGRQLEESTQRMIEEEENAIRSRNNHDGDHSLDHYFDHQLNSKHHGSSYNNKKEEERKPALRAAELTSVRGGGAAVTAEKRRRRRLVQSPAFVTTDKKGDIWSPRDGRSHEKRHSSSSSRGHHSREFKENMYDLEEEGYDAEDVQEEDMFDEGEEYEQQQHHLGLLRVPCSIAVNSGEATHHASSHAKTSMATYVDTGAQVTIISASAAKRAGIYHLIDRRYAGRATGVGQCRILGRIPARHVYFLLGEGRCDEGDDQDYDDEDWLEEGYPHGGDQDDVSTNGRGVQMDGPALTVLEGTVTQGVDILLGLDVLQDWDAEIRMGGKQKSITVHKRGSNGGSSGVVIPFASSSTTAASNRRYTRREEGDRRHPSSYTSTRRHHSRSRSTHRHKKSKAIQDDILSSNFEANDDVQEMEIYEEDTDDEDFSPTASDIESDLDWLDQSGHEFPSEEASYRDGGNSLQDLEDEMLRRSEVGNMDEDDEDTDYDSDEDIEEDLFDMAGY